MKTKILRHLRTIYDSDEDIRIAIIILKTIIVLFFAILVVIGTALFSGNKTLIIILLVGEVMLIAPTILLFRGHIRMTSFVLLLIVLVSMTISAVQDQGIHDVALITFPVIIFFANLLMQRRDFYLGSVFVLVAVGFVGLGELYGWYILNAYPAPVEVDFIIVVLVLLITIMIADQLAENSRKNIHLSQKEIALRKKTQDQLRHLNIHDELTGIYNRTFFNEVLTLMERSRDFPVSMIYGDLDNLKEINDVRGHTVGDELLKHTTETLGAVIREGDILARIGGDEFTVILPRTDKATVNIILSRLRTALVEYNTRNPDLPINISLGVSTSKKGELKKAFIIADKNMYKDKAARKSKLEK